MSAAQQAAASNAGQKRTRRVDFISEVQLYPELDLPPGGRAARELAERWIVRVAGRARCADARQRRAVCRRQKERRRIGQVEELRPELQAKPLGKVEVLENGKIRVPRTRPSGHAACGVAELLNGCARDAGSGARHAERRWIEVGVDTMGVEQHRR